MAGRFRPFHPSILIDNQSIAVSSRAVLREARKDVGAERFRESILCRTDTADPDESMSAKQLRLQAKLSSGDEGTIDRRPAYWATRQSLRGDSRLIVGDRRDPQRQSHWGISLLTTSP
ncbi:hypothetical protein ACNQVK_24900 [Mycobacterium sp. 134]|uniref:hypothetical protein n=1 Tax=Mycobacterium sp. 134 TaxID=3400425 RepID=UPI003AAC893C